MHPILVQIGVFPLYSYGLLLALSFILALYLTLKRADKAGIPRPVINDLALWVLAGGIIGCRLAYVIVNYKDEFQGRLLNIINPLQNGVFGIGGMNLIGGLILATLLGMAFIRWKKYSPLLAADLVMPTVALGIGITRIGCFLNGCCWGKPTGLPWGVTFPPESPAGAWQQYFHCGPVHPPRSIPLWPGLPSSGCCYTWNAIKNSTAIPYAFS
jgi:phosphatidylglycerol---prolipoprotein diacylglyceryl transferase